MKIINVKTDRQERNVIVSGDSQNTSIILLHGFPEDALSFRSLIEKLVKNNFYVIAPDQRGYGKGEHSKDLQDYSIDNLSQDIIDLINHFKLKKTIIVGHDWGGIIAWNLIEKNNELFSKAVILSAPHPYVMKKNLASNINQLIKSWYIFLFQISFLAEGLLKINDYKFFALDIISKSYKKKDVKENLNRIIENLKRDNNLLFMLNWYRAMKYYIGSENISNNTVPVKLVWGKEDPYLSLRLAEDSKKYYQNVELVILEEVSHWPHHESPENLAEIVLNSINY